MRITIVCVGKIKEAFYRDALEEYRKRLQKYIKMDICEVADERTVETPSEAEALQIKGLEGERILNVLREEGYRICLAIGGRQLDSVEFANKLESLSLHGTKRLFFIIGGSLGLSEKVLQKADYLLSFSKMTFPHQLMRVILLEQIYRGYRIIRHEPYHK